MVYIIYGITDCPACLRACADLMEKSCEYVFVETDFAPSYRDSLKEEFSWSTFPIIIQIENGIEQFVGGYGELSKELEKIPR